VYRKKVKNEVRCFARSIINKKKTYRFGLHLYIVDTLLLSFSSRRIHKMAAERERDSFCQGLDENSDAKERGGAVLLVFVGTVIISS
jgi:hypothetical protein